MSRSTVFGARANNRVDAAAVVASLVRRLRMHEISVRNGSRCCTAMKLTIGAFHAGASRLSTRSTRLTPRASSATRLAAVLREGSVFLLDFIVGSIERTRARSSCALRLDPFHRVGPEILARHFEIIVSLQIQPELRAVTEVQTQPQGSIGSYPATVVHDLSDPVRRNTNRLRKLVLRQPVFGQKLLLEHLTRSDRFKFILHRNSPGGSQRFAPLAHHHRTI